MSDGVDGFLALAGLAKAGRLVLEPGVARECAAACADAIAELTRFRDRMSHLTEVLPLGNFACAHDLALILSETTQQYLLRIDEHITCLAAIHDLVGAQVVGTLTSDAATGAALARVGPGQGW
ncbi:hypothetical protein [Skermania piniformis]|uniref:Uncharacterized protein n=1 Tax=Skermania pinensis TaxID=39122 RepID=A0ABX8SC80_9ACTN|nr:hypothetical protein [Skermania piniformis]QXQ15479.1 hypothetical protein KV203_09365 [Skermania piniformis]